MAFIVLSWTIYLNFFFFTFFSPEWLEGVQAELGQLELNVLLFIAQSLLWVDHETVKRILAISWTDVSYMVLFQSGCP